MLISIGSTNVLHINDVQPRIVLFHSERSLYYGQVCYLQYCKLFFGFFVVRVMIEDIAPGKWSINPQNSTHEVPNFVKPGQLSVVKWSHGFMIPHPWLCSRTRVMTSTFMRFLDHTQRRATVGRNPLDEWSARRRDLYLTTHNTNDR
jgi:hypothetical protein